MLRFECLEYVPNSFHAAAAKASPFKAEEDEKPAEEPKAPSEAGVYLYDSIYIYNSSTLRMPRFERSVQRPQIQVQ